jgi:hypothetical protein
MLGLLQSTAADMQLPTGNSNEAKVSPPRAPTQALLLLTCARQPKVALELCLQHLKSICKAPVPEASHVVVDLPVAGRSVLAVGCKSGVALGPEFTDELGLGVCGVILTVGVILYVEREMCLRGCEYWGMVKKEQQRQQTGTVSSSWPTRKGLKRRLRMHVHAAVCKCSLKTQRNCRRAGREEDGKSDAELTPHAMAVLCPWWCYTSLTA